MAYLLDKKREHEAACEKALKRNDHNAATFHAAKAAEFSYALAEQTDGRIAQSHIADAEGWLDAAERIKQKIGKIEAKQPAASNGGSDSGDSSEWKPMEKPGITFDMIAGMHIAKAAILDMVVHPLRQPEKARALGLRPGGGIILFGPPGNGKTMLGKAIATELDAPFYYASGAQIRSKWHGESEQRLSALIQAARTHSVAVLFFDEIEGLLPRRGGKSQVDNRIVTQFLADVGGFEDSENTLLILGATNCPWDIDEAVFRTGRFDEKIYIPPPDSDARLGILRFSLGKVVLSADVDLDSWAARLDGYTGSDIVGIVNAAKRRALTRSVANNTAPELGETDLEDGFRAIPNSITQSLLDKYERFRQQRFAG